MSACVIKATTTRTTTVTTLAQLLTLVQSHIQAPAPVQSRTQAQVALIAKTPALALIAKTLAPALKAKILALALVTIRESESSRQTFLLSITLNLM